VELLLKLEQQSNDKELLRAKLEAELSKIKAAEVKAELDAQKARNDLESQITKAYAERDQIAFKAEAEKEAMWREHENDLRKAELKYKEQLQQLVGDKLKADAQLEGLRTKNQMEERSLSRKDTSEIVKFVPAMLLGVGAIFLAWQKFK
jgi:transketolase